MAAQPMSQILYLPTTACFVLPTKLDLLSQLVDPFTVSQQWLLSLQDLKPS